MVGHIILGMKYFDVSLLYRLGYLTIAQELPEAGLESLMYELC